MEREALVLPVGRHAELRCLATDGLLEFDDLTLSFRVVAEAYHDPVMQPGEQVDLALRFQHGDANEWR